MCGELIHGRAPVLGAVCNRYEFDNPFSLVVHTCANHFHALSFVGFVISSSTRRYVVWFRGTVSES